jgi:hypothetical protein
VIWLDPPPPLPLPPPLQPAAMSTAMRAESVTRRRSETPDHRLSHGVGSP